MQHLIEGYRRFQKNGLVARQEMLNNLAQEGQKPKALVIACIDSRVDPAMIFDAAPGEMLVVRNVANLVPPYAPDAAYHGTSAALEFGIRVLNIPKIVVLGHGLCGGIQALLDRKGQVPADFIGLWMQMAESVRRKVSDIPNLDKRQKCCELDVIKLSLQNLMTFPWIAERVQAGTLTLHGAWFAIHSGELLVMDSGGSFLSVTDTTEAG